jgi:hypothetical protein
VVVSVAEPSVYAIREIYDTTLKVPLKAFGLVVFLSGRVVGKRGVAIDCHRCR